MRFRLTGKQPCGAPETPEVRRRPTIVDIPRAPLRPPPSLPRLTWALLVWCLIAATVVSGCGASGGAAGEAGGTGPTGGTGPSTPTSTPEAPFGLTSRDAPATLRFPTAPAPPTPITRVRAFPALTFASPVFLTAPPDGTDRIAVVEQGGLVRIFPNRDAVAAGEVSTFLDARSLVRHSGEEGLLALAFDPAYASSGRFYTYHTRGSPAPSVLTRWRVSSADANAADPASGEVLLTVEQPFTNHNGGTIAFGPDGMLYLSLGDGGSGNDPGNRSQDMSTLLGKVIRIDVSGAAGYAIPADNPFVGTAGARGEIWALGLRNPYRMAFDRGTGRLWVGDVGQGTLEEIDIVTRGANLGWRVYEGTRSNENPGGLPPSAFTGPVTEYGRSVGTSVTGGTVYRGAREPMLTGMYFYGDFSSGRVFALEHDGTRVTSNREVFTVSNPSAFGEDEAGEVYAVSYGGGIFRITRGAAAPVGVVPERLSETGIFASVAALTPAAGLLEFEPRAPFWSDGTTKRRWIALPGTAQIGFSAQGAWTFPAGTVLVKHFDLDTTAGPRRVETRALVHTTTGWEGYAYVWRGSQAEADLVTAGADLAFDVPDATAPGGVRQVSYRVPSGAQCAGCHTAAAGSILGVRTGQLNHDRAFGAVVDNQLRAWNHVGLFDRDIGTHTALPRITAPSDAGATLSARARAYLEVNCAQCHRPGGPTPVDLDLRLETARADMRAVDAASVAPMGLSNEARIRPGARASSALWERMRRTDATRMPPVSSRVVDPEGEALIGAWIDAGAP